MKILPADSKHPDLLALTCNECYWVRELLCDAGIHTHSFELRFHMQAAKEYRLYCIDLTTIRHYFRIILLHNIVSNKGLAEHQMMIKDLKELLA